MYTSGPVNYLVLVITAHDGDKVVFGVSLIWFACFGGETLGDLDDELVLGSGDA